MSIEDILGLGGILTIIVCVISGAHFLFRKEVRHSSYGRYKKACHVLAVACFCVALGNFSIGCMQHWHYQPMPIMGIVATTISSSQSLLFTIALIILYTGKYASIKRCLPYAVPIIIFPLIFFIATRFQENYNTNNINDFFNHLGPNIPSLVRFIFCITYIVQLGFFTKDFFEERSNYLRQAQNVAGVDSREIRLHWVKIAFLTALVEGIVAILIQIYPCAATESIFRIATILFYSIFPIYYVKYGELYERVKKLEEESHLTEEKEENPDENGMDALLNKLVEKNNQLFEKVEELIHTEKPHLNPETKPEDLIKALATNRTYLANAIKQNKQQTISEYILSLRLKEAQYMLEHNNDLLIEEISIASGFNSLRTFNRNFKTNIGVTPEEYRKNFTA